jgi:hypothetical protein
MYWPVDIPEAQSDLDDLTQTTLGSFAFTKQEFQKRMKEKPSLMRPLNDFA